MIYRDLSEAMGLSYLDYRFVHYGFSIAERVRQILRKPARINRQEAIHRLLARLGGTSYAALAANPHGLILGEGRSVDFYSEIRTRDKKAHLGVPEFLSAVDRLPRAPLPVNPDYPLVLSTTCRTWGNINTIYRNESWRQKHMKENPLVMHPADATALGVQESERVRMCTRTAQAEVPLALSGEILPGTVYLSHGWGLLSRDPTDHSGRMIGTAASLFLPDDEADPFTGLPFYSGIPCRVDPLGTKRGRNQS